MHNKHLLRAVLLLFLGLTGFFSLRGFLIPESFNQYGHYRADNLREQQNHQVVHGGRESCLPCHREECEKVQSAVHRKVQCENCHTPLVDHVKEGKKIAKMSQDRGATLCIRCHEKLVARPKDFPQVDILGHLASMDESFSREICVSCHMPHAPDEDL